MKKYISHWTVVEKRQKGDLCLLKLYLQNDCLQKFPEIRAGQFVQVLVENSPSTFLRRPISIHFVIPEKREIWLLVQIIGEGTRKISELETGNSLNLIYPLGNGFSLPESLGIAGQARNDEDRRAGKNVLLVGGGVGSAPLLYLGHCLKTMGYQPDFLLGASSKENFFDNPVFEKTGNLYITTDDGSAGVKGFVTSHPVLNEKKYDFIYTCGPRPMMKAVVKYANEKNIPCEVSLENTMACGIGACLCCVEKTDRGNVCVCTEGPVFDGNQVFKS